MVRPTSGEPTAALERLADGLLAADEEWRVTYADDRAVELLDLGGGRPSSWRGSSAT